MAKVILRQEAINDLNDIWFYTFDEWSEKQADKYYNLLLDSCQELANSKIVGKHFPEIDKEIFGFRIGQHIIFYRVIQKGTLEIERILHVQMDLKNRITE